MAQATTWAVAQASLGTLGAAAAAPPAALAGMLRASVQASLQSGAQGVLHSMPHQLLLWLLEAEHMVSQRLNTT